MKIRLHRIAALSVGLAMFLPVMVGASGASSARPCIADGRVLKFGFYAYFAPMSFSSESDPASAGFNIHRGYEADLLTALEALEGSRLFSRRGIEPWDGIWLLPADPASDMVGGGITILESLTRDATGKTKIVFTSGHIAFRQSLLVRAADAGRLAGYNDLTSCVRVGVLAGTTGEARLLRLTRLADAAGVLAAGTRLETPRGDIIVDGGARFVISAAGASPDLAGRRRLYPPSRTMPQKFRLTAVSTAEADTSWGMALRAGTVDAVARGEIGNRDASRASGGELTVTALDHAAEHGGFALSVEDVVLAACLSRKIDWLTDGRRIGYAAWLTDPSVFMRRAKSWTRDQ